MEYPSLEVGNIYKTWIEFYLKLWVNKGTMLDKNMANLPLIRKFARGAWTQSKLLSDMEVQECTRGLSQSLNILPVG